MKKVVFLLLLFSWAKIYAQNTYIVTSDNDPVNPFSTGPGELRYAIEQANLHSAQLVEEAKSQAKTEGQRMIELAQGEIAREITQAKEVLKTQLAMLAVAGAEKIIQRNLDPSIHHDLLNELAAEI